MPSIQKKTPSILLVILAFFIVYTVWGSTYFFIAKALEGFPPFFLGTFRFIIAGLLLLAWCKLSGLAIFDRKSIFNSGISGLLMLGVGNGIVIWVEQFMTSGLVAIMVSSAAIWFVILDKKLWKQNFSNKFTAAGLIIGFLGVILLFWEQLSGFEVGQDKRTVLGMVLLIIGPIGWAGGSLYSKYHPGNNTNPAVSTAWQMLIAGVFFLPASIVSGEIEQFHFQDVPASAWWSIGYLIIFGSILAFSAYVWLLQVRSATQVSTYAYVNPVVAVLLAVFFADEMISGIQVIGLIVILGSVLLINLSKYKKSVATQ
ncbi:EamA family transporter [Pedobacter frigoris]|uniref:EamA family transporter n=1 Tax=Pedobacter frigoris TaxID=2571272 RepID=UPI002930B852|nr:EamA family transporter [Pedobacter frigoris]